jgi:hypothetical protein
LQLLVPSVQPGQRRLQAVARKLVATAAPTLAVSITTAGSSAAARALAAFSSAAWAAASTSAIRAARSLDVMSVAVSAAAMRSSRLGLLIARGPSKPIRGL